MKILHLCLSAVFVDKRAYQENELAAEHHRQGHQVLVIANTESHDSKGRRTFVKPGMYHTEEGVPIKRLAYHPLLPVSIGKSLRVHRGLYQQIENFGPDVIMFHGISSGALLTVARYCKRHEEVVLYADNHADLVNSARTFISYWGLHFLYYRPVLRLALPFIRKVFGVSSFTLEFARDLYGVPEEKLEFFPLGGHPVQDPNYSRRRAETRALLGLADDDILFVQSGKQTRIKKLPEVLRAFGRVPDARMRYLVVGLLMDDIREEVEELALKDKRIQIMAWMDPVDLESHLCAADVYMQPGSQSSTMQTSLCCRCPVMLQNWDSHRVYIDENGWLVDTEDDMFQVLLDISEQNIDLEHMSRKSFEKALEMLDYRQLAARLTSGH